MFQIILGIVQLPFQKMNISHEMQNIIDMISYWYKIIWRLICYVCYIGVFTQVKLGLQRSRKETFPMKIKEPGDLVLH